MHAAETWSEQVCALAYDTIKAKRHVTFACKAIIINIYVHKMYEMYSLYSVLIGRVFHC
jgi:hypothetical protein